MRWLPSRGGGAPNNTRSRLALMALALVLSVGVSLALESSAVRVLPLPYNPAPVPSNNAGTAGVAVPAGQQHGQGDGNVRNNQGQEPQHQLQPLSRTQVVALVQRRYRARVVRSHVLQAQGGQQLYEFRLLSAAGMVWTVRVDANSGSEVP